MKTFKLYDHEVMELYRFCDGHKEVEENIFEALEEAGFNLNEDITKTYDSKDQITTYTQELSIAESIQSFYVNRRD